MEVLLLQDVPEVGKKNDLLVVGEGFAMNFLLPQSKAMVATPTVRRRYAEQIKRRALEREMERMNQEQSASAAAEQEVIFTRKATKAGKLYAAITEATIAEEIKSQLSIEVDANSITASEPIKTLGSHTVILSIAGGKQDLQVVVNQE